MKKNRKKIIIILAIVFFALLFGYIYLAYLVVLPTASSANTLTLVEYGLIDPNQVTLKHYVDNAHICDYTLEIKSGIWNQTAQKYELPKFDKGWIEVCVKLERNDGYINARFEKAADLYKNGLLIYFGGDYAGTDKYVYFKSGRDNLYFHKKEEVFDWGPTTDTSAFKKIGIQEMGYVSCHYDYGWKEENKWVKTKP